MKLENNTVLDNDFLVEYNKVAANLADLQETIYELFSKENKKDESIPFDENDHEYNMDFSCSDLINDDLSEYEELLEKWEITTEEYKKIVKWLKNIDDKREKAEKIAIVFAQNLQLLFDLITESKTKIDKKIMDESIFHFKSNIEDIIKEKWKVFEVISSNADIDLKEIDKSPYLYMFNILTREAQRIAKSYKIAYLEEDIYERLKLLWYIDFSDLNLLSKFENTIEKHDLNLWNIEMLPYYKYMFEKNIKNMWNKISFSKVMKYKIKMLQIVEFNIDTILLDTNLNKDIFFEKEIIWHLFLLKDKLESDIKLLGSSITKYNKELLLFPDLTNIIKIHNILNHRKDKKIDPLLDSVTEINDINISAPKKEKNLIIKDKNI